MSPISWLKQTSVQADQQENYYDERSWRRRCTGAIGGSAGITVPQNRLMRGSNKPSRFEETFELYRAKLEL